jgi:uncharacterized protein YndB with AHSA1/START domain
MIDPTSNATAMSAAAAFEARTALAPPPAVVRSLSTARIFCSPMVEMPSEADIRGSAEKIFDLIADFQGQDRWLTQSSSFRGTNDISSNPVTLGTTFREPGPFGVRNGAVTEFERPTKITFHQPMTLKLHAGILDVTVGYTLTPGAGSTNVKRVVSLGLPGRLKLFQPLIAHEFRVESARTLRALKAYADKLP